MTTIPKMNGMPFTAGNMPVNLGDATTGITLIYAWPKRKGLLKSCKHAPPPHTYHSNRCTPCLSPLGLPRITWMLGNTARLRNKAQKAGRSVQSMLPGMT